MTLPPVRRQVVVRTTPQRAFDLWTGAIGAWWPLAEYSVFGKDATVAFVDGEIVETSPDGETTVWGRVLSWDPPTSLRFTWHPGAQPDADGRSGEVEVRFAAVADDLSLVTLHHAGWEAHTDPTSARQEYFEGWPHVLSSYAALAPSGPVADDGPHWLVLEHTAGAQAPDGVVGSSPLFGAHVAFLERLAVDGVLVAAGSLADTADEGMTVIRVPNRAAVVAYTHAAQHEDQAVVQELFDVRVRPWRVALAP